MYIYLKLCHLVQTAHDNSFVLSYGGQGSDPHFPSTNENRMLARLRAVPITDLKALSIHVN